MRQKTLSSSDENIRRASTQIIAKIGNNEKEHYNETRTSISLLSPSHSQQRRKKDREPSWLLNLGRRLPLIGRLIRRLEAEADPAKRADYISSEWKIYFLNHLVRVIQGNFKNFVYKGVGFGLIKSGFRAMYYKT